MKQRVYNVWVIARPSKDVEGEWVGHCLDFDVVSQGHSLDHALRMVLEATSMVVCDDLNHGRDPAQRRAPQEYFATLERVISKGEKIPIDLALTDTSRKRIYAMGFVLTLQRVADVAGTVKTPKSKSKPMKTPVSKPFADVAFAQAC